MFFHGICRTSYMLDKEENNTFVQKSVINNHPVLNNNETPIAMDPFGA